MTSFNSGINAYFVKLLFLIDFIPNFVGIRQVLTPFISALKTGVGFDKGVGV
jgi:hypothetical protein